MEPKGAGDARLVTELAEVQHGVVALRQMLALGLTRGWVKGQHRRGWLHRMHRGVYAVGHRRITREGRWMAAVLACGESAVLSHRSAGELWGLLPSDAANADVAPSQRAVEVTVIGDGGRKRRAGVRVHRSATLRSGERCQRSGIPVTTVARTLLDLGTVLSRRRLERAVDEGERLHRCGRSELRAVTARHRGEPGAGALAALLRAHVPGSTVTGASSRNDSSHSAGTEACLSPW